MKGRLYQKLLTAETTIRKLEKEIKRLKSEIDKLNSVPKKKPTTEKFGHALIDER